MALQWLQNCFCWIPAILHSVSHVQKPSADLAANCYINDDENKLDILVRFGESPAGDAVQQLHKSEETELTIGVSDPIVKNSMNRNGRAKAEFLKQKSIYFQFYVSSNLIPQGKNLPDVPQSGFTNPRLDFISPQ